VCVVSCRAVPYVVFIFRVDGSVDVGGVASEDLQRFARPQTVNAAMPATNECNLQNVLHSVRCVRCACVCCVCVCVW
jgi:hypothetical protein